MGGYAQWGRATDETYGTNGTYGMSFNNRRRPRPRECIYPAFPNNQQIAVGEKPYWVAPSFRGRGRGRGTIPLPGGQLQRLTKPTMTP